MNIYNINWNVLVDNLLPISFRVPCIRAMLKSLAQPVSRIHIDMMAYRDRSLYRIRHNSQICYMEAMLNDLFDNSLRRIRIINVSFREPIYFYEPEEGREVLHYEVSDNKPVWYREIEDFAGEGVDFVVCVPPDLRPSSQAAEITLTTRMSGQVEYYKLYSKNYKIVWQQVNI